MAVGLNNGTVVVWDVYRGESYSGLYELQEKKKNQSGFEIECRK